MSSVRMQKQRMVYNTISLCCAMQKCVFGFNADSEGPEQSAHLLSLIRAFLSANIIIGYYRMYEWRGKARTILCACVGWSESAYFAQVQRHISVWRGPIISTDNGGTKFINGHAELNPFICSHWHKFFFLTSHSMFASVLDSAAIRFFQMF